MRSTSLFGYLCRLALSGAVLVAVLSLFGAVAAVAVVFFVVAIGLNPAAAGALVCGALALDFRPKLVDEAE